MSSEPNADAPRRRGPRRDAAANRRKLEAAATEVFAQLGASAQLEDIAQQAGLGVGTAYRHLGSRDAILYTVMADRIADLVTLADQADRIDDPGQAVTWFLTELAGRVARDRGLMALITNRGVNAEQVEQLRTLIEPRTATLFDRAQASGQLRPDVSFTDIPLLLTCIDRIAEETRTVAPDTWKRLLSIVLDGLRADRPLTTMAAPALTGQQLAKIGTVTSPRGEL